VAERLGPDLPQCFAVHVEGAGQHRVIMAARATHAVQQVIDLVDEGLEQWASGCFDMRQERAQGRILGLAQAGCERHYRLLATATALLKDAGLILDFATKTEDAIRITFEKTFLLLLKQAKKFAVFSEFLPETFSDALPVHKL
jgi:hypothetical protein